MKAHSRSAVVGTGGDVNPKPSGRIQVRSTETVDWLSVHGHVDRGLVGEMLAVLDRSISRRASVVVINLREVLSLDALNLVDGFRRYRGSRPALGQLVFTGARPALRAQLQLAGFSVTTPSSRPGRPALAERGGLGQCSVTPLH